MDAAAAEAWDQAINRLADLLDVVEEALDTDEWDHLAEPFELPALPPLDQAPDASTAARAHLVLEDAARIVQILTVRRNDVAAELATGSDRREAAGKYAAAGRLTR